MGDGFKHDGYGKASQPIGKGKPTMAGASRALRTGGKALADLTGDPDDATVKPSTTPAQRRLQKLLGS